MNGIFATENEEEEERVNAGFLPCVVHRVRVRAGVDAGNNYFLQRVLRRSRRTQLSRQSDEREWSNRKCRRGAEQILIVLMFFFWGGQGSQWPAFSYWILNVIEQNRSACYTMVSSSVVLLSFLGCLFFLAALASSLTPPFPICHFPGLIKFGFSPSDISFISSFSISGSYQVWGFPSDITFFLPFFFSLSFFSPFFPPFQRACILSARPVAHRRGSGSIPLQAVSRHGNTGAAGPARAHRARSLWPAGWRRPSSSSSFPPKKIKEKH
jgi:hypothetical protein